jgi:hypothetical protein
MRDLRVSSWLGLVEALYDIPVTSHRRYRSDFVYRGLADQSWGLQTSLMRMGGDEISSKSVDEPLA